MPITFACPRCARRLTIATRKAGAEVGCPGCKQRVIVPQPPENKPLPGILVEHVEGEPSAQSLEPDTPSPVHDDGADRNEEPHETDRRDDDRPHREPDDDFALLLARRRKKWLASPAVLAGIGFLALSALVGVILAVTLPKHRETAKDGSGGQAISRARHQTGDRQGANQTVPQPGSPDVEPVRNQELAKNKSGVTNNKPNAKEPPSAEPPDSVRNFVNAFYHDRSGNAVHVTRVEYLPIKGKVAPNMWDSIQDMARQMEIENANGTAKSWPSLTPPPKVVTTPPPDLRADGAYLVVFKNPVWAGAEFDIHYHRRLAFIMRPGGGAFNNPFDVFDPDDYGADDWRALIRKLVSVAP